MKTIDGCIKDVLAGRRDDTHCNTIEPSDEMAGAIAKLHRKGVEACGTLPANLVAMQCPSPGQGSDEGGATVAVDDLGELIACQTDINTAGVVPLRNYILSPSFEQILAHPNAADIARCANGIAKGATKLWSAVSKERGRCQAGSDRSAGPYGYRDSDCVDYDGGKIEKAEAKLKARIKRACADTGLTSSELALVGTCGDSNPDAIKTCVVQAVKKNADGLTGTAFELTGICPAVAKLSANAGAADGEVRSRTSLDTGWTGLGHDAEVVYGFVAWVNLDCNEDCSSCAITANCDEDNCRCSHDPSIVCHTPFGVGGVCGGANVCEPHFGPPLPLVAGGAATCVTNVITDELVGSGDVGTGASTTEIRNAAKVHLGISQTEPCPVCSGVAVGDLGVCSGGQRGGLTCTTNAISPAFGNLSYDCPPAPSTNITGGGLQLSFALTSGQVSLPFADACDAPLGSFACACGACTLDPTVACSSDADCAGAGLGTCTNAGGPPRQPNGCADLTCNPDPAAGVGEGTCDAGPDDFFCSGALKGNGEGYVPCSTDGDCGSAVGGGTCSLTKQRECFLDPIAAAGIAGLDGAELVSAFCTGPTTSASVNAAAGIPAAARLRLDLDYTTRCPDRVTPYEFGGVNCP